MARRGTTALLIVDMINTFDFTGGDALLRQTERVAPHVAELKRRFAAAQRPIVYCNDNFGQWRSDFRAVFDRCSRAGAKGAEIAALLRPGADDYFVLKPKHSAFYATPLELLLASLRVKHVVVTGIAGDGCVYDTAADAHMREYEVTVVSDATASQTPARNRRALAQLSDAGYARIVRAADA